jgi:hypothetical protein
MVDKYLQHTKEKVNPLQFEDIKKKKKEVRHRENSRQDSIANRSDPPQQNGIQRKKNTH